MKKRRIVNAILRIDPLHERIDLHRWVAHLLALVVICWWAASGDTYDGFLLRALAAGIFMIVTRFMLSRLGASRFAALSTAGIFLALTASYTVSDIMLINFFVTTALLVQEYLVSLKKHMAIVAAVALGVMLPFANGQHKALFAAVVLVLGARIASYLLQERIPKKTFVLFCIKAAGIVGLALIINYVIRLGTSSSYDLPDTLPSIHAPVWLIVVLALLALRGLWATMLLQTKRSPQHRSLRLFYIAFTVILLAIVSLISQYGDTVFLPDTLQKLTAWGFVSPSITLHIYTALTIGLLITAGTDRWFSTSSQAGQALSRRLGFTAVSNAQDAS